MPDSPASKYTLKEWIRHPTTIMLIISVNLIWVLIIIIVNMGKDSGDDRIKDLSAQVEYLKNRVGVLEKQVDKYTTAILYKDGQILVRDNVIDSLRKEATP